jgi:uncharacterized Zn finger protein
MGYGSWPRYVPVAERRRKAEREMAKLRKKGKAVTPVVIEGRTIASSFWGAAWCDTLETYRDYDNRLERGRTYVRNGSVLDLQILPLEIKALVSGSEIYRVGVSIKALTPARWRALCRDCSGAIESLIELLQGRFSKGVMARLCDQDKGLFPKPSEIKFSCSCPDGASLCKHVAAVLYGVGARLYRQPELLFRLRSVDHRDLVAGVDASVPLSKTAPAPDRILEAADMSALFGFDLAAADSPPPPPLPEPGRPAGGVVKAAAGKMSAAVKPLDRKVIMAVKKLVAETKTRARPKPAPEPVEETTAVAERPKAPRRKRGAVWDPADIAKA